MMRPTAPKELIGEWVLVKPSAQGRVGLKIAQLVEVGEHAGVFLSRGGLRVIIFWRDVVLS